jgi:hypothetical protein
MELEQNLYFDPFAENGAELFDPTEAFAQIKANYQQGGVEHDYSADNFVKDTEALLMDAAFLERFDAVQAIAAEMHRMCGEDHAVRSAMSQSDYFGAEDSHNHQGHDHSHEDDNRKKKKKEKKKKQSQNSKLKTNKQSGIWALMLAKKERFL